MVISYFSRRKKSNIGGEKRTKLNKSTKLAFPNPCYLHIITILLPNNHSSSDVQVIIRLLVLFTVLRQESKPYSSHQVKTKGQSNPESQTSKDISEMAWVINQKLIEPEHMILTL